MTQNNQERLAEILLKNAVPEEQNKHLYKTDGSILFIEGSYIQYLASAILEAIELDVEEVNSVLKQIRWKDFIPVNGVRGRQQRYVIMRNYARKRIIKAIASAKDKVVRVR